MKKLLYIIGCLSLLMASCDKVDEYIVYAGATAEWTPGSGVANKVQRALLEKYTGPHCTNCPPADEVIHGLMDTYGDKLVAVSIVDSSNFGLPYANQPDLRTQEGNLWSQYFGISRYPTVIVQRAKDGGNWVLNTSTDNVGNLVAGVVGENTRIAVGLTPESGNKVKVDLEFVEKINDPITLTLLVIEDSIKAKQASPAGSIENYENNHILRTVITDIWGADVECTGVQGEKLTATFTYKPSVEWKLENCKVVGFVSDKVSREVYNCAQCAIQ